MARKRKRKLPGCSTLVMLMAAFFAGLTIFGFVVMVWTALLLEQDDAQNATCHLSLVGVGGISVTATNEPEATLTPIWAVTPDNKLAVPATQE